MRCEQFRENWTAWHEDWLDPDTAHAMQAHCGACSECARFDAHMRRMVEALATLAPAGEPGRTEAPAAARADAAAASTGAPSPWGVRRVGGLAATLVIGVLLGLLLAQPNGPGVGALDARVVSFDSPGVHEVTVAFESPRRLESVEFVVELPPGAEMVGFPGQRQVRWSGRLKPGKSRLDLPLRIAEGARLGELVARVQHRSGERSLSVPLRLQQREGSNGSV